VPSRRLELALHDRLALRARQGVDRGGLRHVQQRARGKPRKGLRASNHVQQVVVEQDVVAGSQLADRRVEVGAVAGPLINPVDRRVELSRCPACIDHDRVGLVQCVRAAPVNPGRAGERRVVDADHLKWLEAAIG
jgi:hypothetical protein